MKPTSECKPSSCDYWIVSEAARRLGSQACTLGARHIKDGTLRLQFGREVSYYAKSIVDAVAQGEKSPEQALKDLKSEQSSLLSQSTEIAQKGVGVIAGAFQFAAGVGICYGSAGTLCLLAGAPMMAHGANNIYENGKNLWEGRKDTEGPVRKGYQEVSKMMGGGELEGNMAYGAVDLGLSVYGIRRMVLKPDAWRLFKYVKTDYIRSYKIAGKNTLILEGVSDSLTGRSMYREYKEKQETQENP